MAQACIFLATGYEEVEMLTVVDMLRRAKISIDMVSITDQKEVTSSHNVTITADKTLSEVNFEEAEMLILPGGIPGTPNLRACTALCEKLKDLPQTARRLLLSAPLRPFLASLESWRARKQPAILRLQTSLRPAIM